MASGTRSAPTIAELDKKHDDKHAELSSRMDQLVAGMEEMRTLLREQVQPEGSVNIPQRTCGNGNGGNGAQSGTLPHPRLCSTAKRMDRKEVYEEELRTGNLHHDPTINTGLCSARCPRCPRRLNPKSETAEFFFHHGGKGIGGMLGSLHCLYIGLPYLQKCLKGPKWLPFVVGIPPFLIISGASAAFGGYVIPKLAQLNATTYETTSSASIYVISLLTRRIEENYIRRLEENYNSDAQPVKRL